MALPNADFVLVVKRDCPTCTLVEPVVQQLSRADLPLVVYSQDDPDFPSGVSEVVDDRELAHSYRLSVEIVPTLIRLEAGRERARAVGWHREEWERVSGVSDLGLDLRAHQPGCGSLTMEPGWAEELAVRFGDSPVTSRKSDVFAPVDPHEVCYDRGWSDGLPVIPPTEVRVLRMLAGTTRKTDEVVGTIPPSGAECTVEKVAINAVMAGCRPEYLPVVLAAVEAVLEPEFSMHGVLCTTDFAGPILILNGPIIRRIAANSGINAFGQGNRANATIGRALQLLIRNMGGGVPGGIDRATFGTPGKYSFCFAEDESDPDWEPLSVERGFSRDASTVTLYAGGGIQAVWEQTARSPDALTETFASSLQAVGSVRLAHNHKVLFVLSPDHHAIYRTAGWSRARIKEALYRTPAQPGAVSVHQTVDQPQACTEGDGSAGKLRPGDLTLVRAGGPAGFMSVIIPGWWTDSTSVTKEIGT